MLKIVLIYCFHFCLLVGRSYGFESPRILMAESKEEITNDFPSIVVDQEPFFIEADGVHFSGLIDTIKPNVINNRLVLTVRISEIIFKIDEVTISINKFRSIATSLKGLNIDFTSHDGHNDLYIEVELAAELLSLTEMKLKVINVFFNLNESYIPSNHVKQCKGLLQLPDPVTKSLINLVLKRGLGICSSLVNNYLKKTFEDQRNKSLEEFGFSDY